MPAPTMTVSGLVEMVRCKPNGWTTVRLRVDGHPGPVFARGFCATLSRGQRVRVSLVQRRLRGKPKPQWFIEDVGEILIDGRDAADEAMAKNLADLLPGVGTETARRLVALGIDRLLADPQLLADRVASRFRHDALTAWEKHRSEIHLRNVLRTAGLGLARQRELLAACGGLHAAKSRLARDPWSFANELPGIGFLTMDAVAREMGIPLDSEARILAGLAFTANRMAERSGDTIFAVRDVLARAAAILNVPPPAIAAVLEGAGDIFEVVDDGWVGPVNLIAAEEAIAYTVEELRGHPGVGIAAAVLDDVARSRGLDAAQREALSVLSSHAVSALTGQPGTGKTTVMGAFVEACGRAGVSVVLICPTGSAARRLATVAGRPASTIHRWLGRVERDPDPAPVDVIIVDESSMLSSPLAGRLLGSMRAVSNRIIFAGDDAQLPPVEAGKPFRDLLNARALATCRLLKIWRQAGSSVIPFVARAITENRDPRDDPTVGVRRPVPVYAVNNDAFVVSHGPGWRYVECATAEAVQREALLETMKQVSRFGPDDVATLAANYRDIAGVNALSASLQQHYNPRPAKVVVGDVDEDGLQPRWCQGDPVMFLGNDYRYIPPLTHAMRGRILGLDVVVGAPRMAHVQWEDGEIRSHEFTPEGTLPHIVLAYALTVHRSQGAEFAGVVFALCEHNLHTATREAVYTALTRAKQSAVLVAQRGTLRAAISRRGTDRNTALSHLLRRPWAPPF